MIIASLNNCENIKLQNFTVDWDRPFIYQGEYLEVTDQHIDMKFDHSEYPYLIEDSLFYLTGEAWKARPSGWFIIYDKDKKEIVYRTYDSNNRSVFSGKAAEIGPGVVRFFGKPCIKPDPGTIETIYAGTYITDCIQIFDCKNTILKIITVYHGLSTGFYGRRSENITMDNVNMSINEKKGRVFSVIADASHFTICKGLIKIENCSHTGQGDDWINVRGQNNPIASIVDKYSLITVRPRQQPITREGDEIWFINKESVQRCEFRTVKSIEAVLIDGKATGYKLVFTEPIPNTVKSGDFFENKTWNPSVEIRNCQILKKHRARGILITTPQKVIIENNYFRSAGASLLIEGDVNFWFCVGFT